jgi:murein DD-endopeptidase MepM/ murein hydrolase activator NlpD
VNQRSFSGSLYRPALVVVLAVRAAIAEPIRVAVDPHAVSVGGLVVVRADATDVSGTFEGRELAFSPAVGGSIALVGIDLDHPAGRFPLSVSNSRSGRFETGIEVLEKEFPEERLTVPKDYTELGPKTLRRVEREKRLLAALWSESPPERHWRGEFVKPADGAPGSPFGLRRFFNGQPRSPHSGIDFRAREGAPVKAANRGRVVLSQELFFTGNTIVIDHGLGLFTLYVHLSRLDVGRGAMVGKGQRIGRVGATGRVTGPHLHFAARLGAARIDPALLLERDLD